MYARRLKNVEKSLTRLEKYNVVKSCVYKSLRKGLTTFYRNDLIKVLLYRKKHGNVKNRTACICKKLSGIATLGVN